MGNKSGASVPRVAVNDGQFVREDDAFTPRGFNYIRLRERDDGFWHDTFNPNSYDPAQAEAMFADLADTGFNLVRVFIDPETGAGVAGDPETDDLSETYLRNVADFLRQAGEAGVYVVPTFAGGLPPLDRYHERAGDAPEWAGGTNRQYVDPTTVAAFAAFRRDVIEGIVDVDSGALDAVFAIELENESHFVADHPPFSLSGEIEIPHLGTYDMDDWDEAQALADDAARNWARTNVDALRDIDPDTLISADVFTFSAVGRDGPGDLRDAYEDTRFPVRPLALASVDGLDYVDIHYYPHHSNGLEESLDSVEFDRLRETCKRAGKPILLGEFGAPKDMFDLEEAAESMSALWTDLRDRGFDGYCYWTYDRNGQDWLWMGKEGDSAVLDALADAG